VGRAGEATAFDPTRHEAVGPVPAAGAPVTVLRPGYGVDVGDGEEVLLHRAQVVGPPR
jgi:hypothetical protein